MTKLQLRVMKQVLYQTLQTRKLNFEKRLG